MIIILSSLRLTLSPFIIILSVTDAGTTSTQIIINPTTSLTTVLSTIPLSTNGYTSSQPSQQTTNDVSVHPSSTIQSKISSVNSLSEILCFSSSSSYYLEFFSNYSRSLYDQVD